MKESEALALVATLRAAFPRQQMDDATLRVYALDLADLDAATASEAVRTLRRTSRFFPTIAEIREGAATLQLGAPEPMAAWAQAVSRDGERHELVQRARRIVGDSFHWREAPSGVLRRAFLDAYAEVRDEAMREIVAPPALPAPAALALGEG